MMSRSDYGERLDDDHEHPFSTIDWDRATRRLLHFIGRCAPPLRSPEAYVRAVVEAVTEGPFELVDLSHEQLCARLCEIAADLMRDDAAATKTNP
jgi:hypothetical protein